MSRNFRRGGGGSYQPPPQPKVVSFKKTIDTANKTLTWRVYCTEGTRVARGKILFFRDGDKVAEQDIDQNGYAECTFKDMPAKVSAIRAQIQGKDGILDDTVDFSGEATKKLEKPTDPTEPTYIRITAVPEHSGVWKLLGQILAGGKPVNKFPVDVLTPGEGLSKEVSSDVGEFESNVELKKDSVIKIRAGRLKLNLPLAGPEPIAPSIPVPGWWNRYNNWVFLAATIVMLWLGARTVHDVWTAFTTPAAFQITTEQNATGETTAERLIRERRERYTGSTATETAAPEKNNVISSYASFLAVRAAALASIIFAGYSAYRKKWKTVMISLGLGVVMLVYGPKPVGEISYFEELAHMFLPFLGRHDPHSFIRVVYFIFFLTIWLLLIPVCFADEAFSLFRSAMGKAEEKIRGFHVYHETEEFEAQIKEEQPGKPVTVFYINGHELKEQPVSDDTAQHPEKAPLRELLPRMLKAEIASDIILGLIKTAARHIFGFRVA